MTSQKSSTVSPDAVRVWRGFKIPSLGVDQFHSILGTVFIPATVKMQINAGLHSYTPTVLSGLPNKPDSVPDETALVFWNSQQDYEDAQAMLAVSSYELNHKVVFAMPPSHSKFPVPFNGSLVVDVPVYLIDKPADWMYGSVKHLVGSFPSTVTSADFLDTISEVLSTIQKIENLQGAIACASEDYLAYWELGPAEPMSNNVPSGIPLLKEKLTDWSQDFTASSTPLPVGLWERWPGMNVVAGGSFNMQFERRAAK